MWKYEWVRSAGLCGEYADYSRHTFVETTNIIETANIKFKEITTTDHHYHIYCCYYVINTYCIKYCTLVYWLFPTVTIISLYYLSDYTFEKQQLSVQLIIII